MNESATPSQLDRELRDLRARAYGPHPDIQDDPEAFARLAELESAHLTHHVSTGLGGDASEASIPIAAEAVVAADAPLPGTAVVRGEPGRPESLWQKATASTTGRVWLTIGTVIVVLGAVFAATWFDDPKPEATLKPTGLEPGSSTLSAVSFAEVDGSTLRGYEEFRGLAPWVAENAHGSRCIMGIEGGTVHGMRCAPPGAELMIDFGSYPLDYTATYMEGLADGTVIRFQLHGDSVDVYLFAPPGAD